MYTHFHIPCPKHQHWEKETLVFGSLSVEWQEVGPVGESKQDSSEDLQIKAKRALPPGIVLMPWQPTLDTDGNMQQVKRFHIVASFVSTKTVLIFQWFGSIQTWYYKIYSLWSKSVQAGCKKTGTFFFLKKQNHEHHHFLKQQQCWDLPFQMWPQLRCAWTSCMLGRAWFRSAPICQP